MPSSQIDKPDIQYFAATSSQILDSRHPISGLKPRFLNDLDVISEDELIVSDSSTRHDRRHFMPLM